MKQYVVQLRVYTDSLCIALINVILNSDPHRVRQQECPTQKEYFMSKKQRNPKSNKTENRVSAAMSQLVTVLQEVESMKELRDQCADDESLSASEKKRRLAGMNEALFLTEHLALMLMQNEIDEGGDIEPDNGEESGEYFQWLDPATPEDAWKQIQWLVPEVDNMKAKITVVELDPSIPLSAKAEQLAYMKECVQFVQLRIVELSERYLQNTKCAA